MYIASHIHIPNSGPVADYVHYHEICWQLIFCWHGQVKVVYEGQGEPFILYPGSCVLQPPGIRHQVLETRGALDVVEIGCPADHVTFKEQTLKLPTFDRSSRLFNGQSFKHFSRKQENWQPWHREGWEGIDYGMLKPSGGLVSLWVIRASDLALSATPCTHSADFLFLFVLSGTVKLVMCSEETSELAEGDSVAIPKQCSYALQNATGEILHVSTPAPGDVNYTTKSSL